MKKPSSEELVAIIEETNGNVSTIARGFNRSRTAIYQWIQSDTAAGDALKKFRILKYDETTAQKQWGVEVHQGKKTYGYVYFVRESFIGLVKVGSTKNLGARLASLQTGCPQDLQLLAYIYSDAYRSIEKLLHSKFSDKNHRAEWFSLTNDDVIKCADFLGGHTLVSCYDIEFVNHSISNPTL